MIPLTPWQKYQQDLKNSDFVHDSAQEQAVLHLQRLYDELLAKRSVQGPLKELSKWFLSSNKQQKIKGLYFWGGVGRGKTYLVDTFYECLPIKRKIRIHFHRFMYRVHQELRSLAGQSDPLKVVASRFAKEAKIICFDEFYVSDITDAMILGTLMEELFKHDVVLVATSNIIPDQLYRNGLQRSRFLPAIALLNQHTEIVNVDGGIDYRLRTLKQAEIYHSPLDEQASANLYRYFEQLASEVGQKDQQINLSNRLVTTIRNTDGVVMFDFQVMCESPRSQTDYMEISRCFHTVLLSGVKQMGQHNDDAARRFIAMVDEFYERNVKLIISAAVPIESLYTQGQLGFEFRRCLSRLQEMQSIEYLALPHLP